MKVVEGKFKQKEEAPKYNTLGEFLDALDVRDTPITSVVILAASDEGVMSLNYPYLNDAELVGLLEMQLLSMKLAMVTEG